MKRSTIVSLVGCLSDVDDFCLMFVRRLSDVENACLMSNRVCLKFVGFQSREKYNEVPPNSLYLRGLIWEKGPPEILSTERRVPGVQRSSASVLIPVRLRVDYYELVTEN